MIYTCYEMIRDCRADKPEGWSYLVSNYVPVIRKLLAHYDLPKASDQDFLHSLLRELRDPASSLLQSMEPAPERWFIAELRQRVLARLPVSTASISLDLEILTAALEPLTLLEKQAVWIEGMGYDGPQTGAQLRMSAATVAKIRAKASDLIRGKVDSWSRGIVVENGRSLGQAAAAQKTDSCLPAKTFLDVLDGRTNWSGRAELERHVANCWHCIDHYCRLVEVVELIRGIQPLSEPEAAPIRGLLGIDIAKKKRWFG